MPKKAEQLFDVSKKTVLITGASGYLGREIASLFALNRAEVILLGRSDRIRDVASRIKKETGSKKVRSFQTDFYRHDRLKAGVDRIKKEFDVDVLINNAYDMSSHTGFNTPSGKLEELGYEPWLNAFQSGIYWAFYISKEIGETMKGRGGSIINVGSMYGVVSPDPALYENTPFFNPATYGVMKSGILALTRYLAAFWARHNIRCNAVSPGPFPNIRTKSANSVDPESSFLQRVAAKTMLKRFGKPEELDGVFLLLASEAGSYITGQNILVDGGWVSL